MTAGRLRDLRACAVKHLDDYTDPAMDYAFTTYDHQGDPARLAPMDFLAPVLLSVPMQPAWVRELFKPTGPWSALRAAMQAVLDDKDCWNTDFIDLDLQHSSAWRRVDEAVFASGQVKHYRGVAVTKALHRKRPDLVPILDGLVYGFYMGKSMRRGPYDETPRGFWPVLQRELDANRDWLAKVAAGRETPDHRPLSLLRTADIIVWTHVKTQCTGQPGLPSA